VNPLQAIVIFAPPAVFLLATIEALILWRVREEKYDWRAYWASIADMAIRNYPVRLLLGYSIAGPLIGLAWPHSLFTVPLDTGIAIAALFAGQEFCYYWFHRASHRVRWFWATLAVHHSSNQFNLAASYRFGWTGGWSGTAVFYVPLAFLGFPPLAIFTMLSLNLLYQFWLHVDWIPKLGPLEWVLNTPSHHRVHHAANGAYLDANYGGVLILFDRLFGTLVEERADLPCRYGLVTPLLSSNPLRIGLHEWMNLGRDLWLARSWRERWDAVAAPPGDHHLMRKAPVLLPAE
jgi:sterol desaturase/sphingolipid hydroxylase (fatty acid hydroxylase superfamily)